MNELIEKNMEKGMTNYNQTGFDGVTKTWDIVQREVGSRSSDNDFSEWFLAYLSGDNLI